jgi:hypothetical protein
MRRGLDRNRTSRCGTPESRRGTPWSRNFLLQLRLQLCQLSLLFVDPKRETFQFLLRILPFGTEIMEAHPLGLLQPEFLP